MEQSSPAPSTTQEKRSARLLFCGLGSAVLGFAGHKLQMHMPATWRGDEGVWDLWSHIGNVPDTMMVVSAAALSAAWLQDRLFQRMPLRRALGVASIGFAVGCGVNAAVETPGISEAPVVQALFPDREPDLLDQLYGDAAALAQAGFLAWAAKKQPDSP